MMKKLLLKITAILSFSIAITSCSEEIPLSNCEQSKIVSVAFADIATRSNGGDLLGGEGEYIATKADGGTMTFVEGDQITIVGAASEEIIFVLKADGDWMSINQYEWLDSPQTVTAYFGKGATVENGEQMPDIYKATIECNGFIPEDGVLSFGGDKAFKHTSALIKIQINDFESTTPPAVQLVALHQISYVNYDGTYQKDSNSIKSITFELIDSNDSNFTYEAKVPSGEDNLLVDYALKVGDENVFNYVENSNQIPTSFVENKIYTFKLNYTTTQK